MDAGASEITAPSIAAPPLNNTQQTLFNDHQNWAVSLSKRWLGKAQLPSAEWPAYHNAALIGLWHSVKKYDPEQGNSFKTFAFMRIMGSIKDNARSADTMSRQDRTRGDVDAPKFVRLDAPAPSGERAMHSIIPATRANERCPADIAETLDELKAAWSKIPLGQARDVATMYFEEQLSMKEIGERLDLSESRISQVLQRGLACARENGGGKS